MTDSDSVRPAYYIGGGVCRTMESSLRQKIRHLGIKVSMQDKKRLTKSKIFKSDKDHKIT